MSERRVLLVGGIDSSGRAGLDADREAAKGAACEAVEVASALTDQDLFEVKSVEERLLWHREAEEAVSSGPPVAALKFGLLPGVSSVVEAARFVARARHGAHPIPAVVDPVARSSSGYRFWSDAELVAVRDSLIVAGPILTPNLHELALLTWDDPEALADDPARRIASGERLLEAGASAVVVTGGHGRDTEPARDLVLRPGAAPVWIERNREPGEGIRGSGCRFATTLACGLAAGEDLVDATRRAGEFVAERIREAAAADDA